MLQTQLNYSSFFFILIFPFFCFSFDFNLSEIEKDFFVHFGVQEDSNRKNKGDIANLGFIIGKKSVLVIDTGGTIEIANKFPIKSNLGGSNISPSTYIIGWNKKDKITTTKIAIVPNIVVNLKFKTVADIITGPKMNTANGFVNPPVK